jgi:hypothetical protein
VAECTARLEQLEASERAEFTNLLQGLGLPAVFVLPRKAPLKT